MKLLLSIHANNKNITTKNSSSTTSIFGAGQHSMFVPMASPQANETAMRHTNRSSGGSIAFVATILLLLVAAGAVVSSTYSKHSVS